jgi:hypothetical protein
MRYIKILIGLLLFAVPCTAEIAVKSGSVTKASTRLSTVASTAFVDFLGTGSVTLADYVGYKIKLCSVTDNTQCATGYVKAASTGETLGPELVTGGDFETNVCGSTWTCQTGWAMDSGNSGKATFSNASSTGLIQTAGSVIGALYRLTFDLDAYSGSRVFAQLGTPGTLSTGQVSESVGTKVFYLLANAAYANHSTYGYAGATATIDNFSRKQVVSPSATGVLVVSSPGGTTYSWTSNTLTTQINDTAGYTYEIYPTIAQTISGNDNTISYGLIDCEDSPGMAGMLVTGTGNTIKNYTVARCPGGAFQFDESATLTNSIGISSGPDITIASGKTVTGKNNLFGDAAKAGDGTYSDAGSTTLWSTDPVFVNPSAGNFRLQSTSPAIDAGARDEAALAHYTDQENYTETENYVD